MKKLRRTDLLLLCLLAVFTAGWLLTELTRRKAEVAPAKAYYLTAYETPGDLLAVQIVNESGTLTVVHHEEDWITDTDLPGVGADEEAASQLFSAASRIRVSEPVAGASPEDAQFGLTKPRAEILVEDRQEGGISFLIGNETPDGSACYVCALQGKEVFLLSSASCQAFLEDIHRYLDLRVFSEIDTDRIEKLSVSDPEGMRYELSAAGKGRITGARYYDLTHPVRLVTALSRTREIFSSLEELRAGTVRSDLKIGEEDLLYELAVTQEGEKERRYRIAAASGGKYCIENMDSGITGVIDELPVWLAYDAAGVLGGALLSLSGQDVVSLELSAGGKMVRYDSEEGGIEPELVEELNRIPIGMAEGSAKKGKEVLRCRIRTGREVEEEELVFFDTGQRQCEISVNGVRAFTCAASALDGLVKRTSGA